MRDSYPHVIRQLIDHESNATKCGSAVSRCIAIQCKEGQCSFHGRHLEGLAGHRLKHRRMPLRMPRHYGRDVVQDYGLDSPVACHRLMLMLQARCYLAVLFNLFGLVSSPYVLLFTTTTIFFASFSNAADTVRQGLTALVSE